MKINLGCGDDIRSGYINIDRLPPGQISSDIYKQGDIASLDWLTEDNTIEEMVALDCLEYLSISSIQTTLANWVKKLVSGGTLKILVPDCHAVAVSFSQGQLNLNEYLNITFGSQEKEDNRLSAIDALTLLETLDKLGLTLVLKRYEGIALYVEVKK